MITTIMFDLDGTLIPMSQDEFIKNYFGNLAIKMMPHGLDKDTLIPAVWEGTKAMIQNDGKKKNEEVFWNCFAQRLGDEVLDLIPVFESFYENEFNKVKEIIKETELSKEIIKYLKGKGYTVILATNPLFPPVAVKSRLSWIGLSPEDFDYITTYDNSSYCKPNLDYYREILEKNHKQPEECVMIGNNMVEDMCALQLGIKTFLVTDFIEDGEGKDITQYTHGSLAKLKEWVENNY